MDRRYQVFVSSTFLDLADERQVVISTLLNLDAMPAGMELFPATDDDAWTLIKQVIDESDYYLLVVGGRYGAIDADTQLSYTEKEFDYAVSRGKPVMAFLHGDPGSIALAKSEQSEEARDKLNVFRAKVEQQKHVKYWAGSDNLAGQVALSFPKLQRAHPAVGWVRGNLQTSNESLAELHDLRKRLEAAETELDAARRGPPPGTQDLMQGADQFHLPVELVIRARDAEWNSYDPPSRVQLTTSWDSVFGSVGPKLLDECSEAELRKKLNSWFAAEAYDDALEQSSQWLKENGITVEDHEIVRGWIYDDDFETILLQFRALGLITQSERKRSLKDTGTYWTLTQYGDARLTTLRAVRRKEAVGTQDDSPREDSAA